MRERERERETDACEYNRRIQNIHRFKTEKNARHQWWHEQAKISTDVLLSWISFSYSFLMLFLKLGEFLRNISKKIVITFSFNELFYIYKTKLRKISLDLRTWNIKIEENREYMNRALVLLSSPGKNHSRSQHEAITFSS